MGFFSVFNYENSILRQNLFPTPVSLDTFKPEPDQQRYKDTKFGDHGHTPDHGHGHDHDHHGDPALTRKTGPHFIAYNDTDPHEPDPGPMITLDHMPIPQIPYQTVYNDLQRKLNIALAVNTVFLVLTMWWVSDALSVRKKFDCFRFGNRI